MTQEDISEILYRYDLEGLASMGATDKTYDSEARMIAEGMDECEDEDELAELIASVFTDMFCFATNPHSGARHKTSVNYKAEGTILEVAAEIWEGLQ